MLVSGMATPRLTPRKKPRQARSQALVEAALVATERVLAEEGFEAMTTNRVAEVAGISVGSLYQYFPSKESLVTAVVVSVHEDVLDRLAQALLTHAESPWPVVGQQIVDAFLAPFADEARARRLLPLVEVLGTRRKTDVVDAQISALLGSLFEARRGQLRSLERNAAAVLVTTFGFVGAATWALAGGGRTAQRAEMVAFVVGGLARIERE